MNKLKLRPFLMSLGMVALCGSSQAGLPQSSSGDVELIRHAAVSETTSDSHELSPYAAQRKTLCSRTVGSGKKTKGISQKTLQKMRKAADTLPPANGIRLFFVNQQGDKMWDEYPRGAYYVDVEGDKKAKLYFEFDDSEEDYPYIDASCGGVTIDDTYYMVTWNWNNWPMTDIITSYNAVTWEWNNDYKDDDYKFSATDMAYDSYSDRTFAYSEYYYPESTTRLTVLDFDKLKRRQVGPIKEYDDYRIVALAAGRDCLYGFTPKGSLYKIDKETGENTYVGETGLDPGFMFCSATVDAKSGRLFWSVTSYKNGRDFSGIFEINTETAEATPIYTYDWSQQELALWAQEPTTSECPALATNLKVNTESGELKGNLTFKMPESLFSGSPAGGEIEYEVLLDGKQIATGKAMYGASVEVPFAVDESGSYKFSVRSKNAQGPSRWARLMTAVGYPTPESPEVKLSFDGEIPVIEWNAVTLSDAGADLDPEQITYRVSRQPENIIVADGITELTIRDTNPFEENLGFYYYNVEAILIGEVYSRPTKSDSFYRGHAMPPYRFEGYSNENSGCFTIIDSNGDGNSWEFDTTMDPDIDYYRISATYGSVGLDDWLITPPVRLEAGKWYSIGVIAKSPFSYEMNYEVKLGNHPDADSMTVDVCNGELNDKNKWNTPAGFIKAPATGDFHIGLHTTSEAGYLYTKGFFINGPYNGDAPDMITDFKAISDPAEPKKVNISFKAPTMTIDRNALTSAITEITITRGDEPIKTFTGVEPGASVSFTDHVETTGQEYEYMVCASNDRGPGRPFTSSEYIGVRKPSEPVEPFAYQTTPGKIMVKWNAPTTDELGNSIDASNITYSVYSQEGYARVNIAENISETFAEYNFDLSDFEGQTLLNLYIYASTEGGDSETVSIVPVAVGYPYTLPWHESLENVTPSGVVGNFNLQGDAAWGLYSDSSFTDISSFDNDGGMLGMHGSKINDSAMVVFGNIDLSGCENPALSFYSYNIAGTNPDTNTLEVMINDGTGFKSAGVFVMNSNNIEGWNRFVADLKDYKGKTIQLALKGTVKIYTYTLLDNLMISEYLSDNLVLTSANAPREIEAGETFATVVKVMNVGSNDASDFTIRLSIDNEDVNILNPDLTLRPGEAQEIELTHAFGIFDQGKHSMTIHVDHEADLAPEDNHSDTFEINVIEPVAPKVTELRGETGPEGRASLEWDEPDLSSIKGLATIEGFENASGWEKESACGWTFLDADGFKVGGFQNVTLPGITGSTGFFVVDSSMAGLNASWASHSGKFHISNIYNSGGACDDWAISPKLSGSAQTVKFWAKSYSSDATENMEILYSDEEKVIADFQSIQKWENIDAIWKEYTVDLPEGAQYFAFRCTSDDCYMLMIDDISFIRAAEFVPTGYNVYRNGVKINSEPIEQLSYIDNPGADGTYRYNVSVMYPEKESAPSPDCLIITNGVKDIIKDGVSVYGGNGYIRIHGAEGKQITISDVSGMVMNRINGHYEDNINISEGIYIVRIGNKSVKVNVR